MSSFYWVAGRNSVEELFDWNWSQPDVFLYQIYLFLHYLKQILSFQPLGMCQMHLYMEKLKLEHWKRKYLKAQGIKRDLTNTSTNWQ